MSQCFIFGRRITGYFDIRSLDGIKLNASVKYTELKLLESFKTILIERRRAIKKTFPPMTEYHWFPCPNGS